MARYGVPGVSVAIIDGDEIVVLEALGVADMESGEPLYPATSLQAASVSKAVAAFGAMTLVDNGQLSLSAPANQYLSTWKIPSSPLSNDDPVDLAELLSHSGGISVPSYPGFERGADLPSIDDILEGQPNAYSARVELVGDQGAYRYSGGGYMVVQKMIEEVTGRSFEHFMQEAVFSPLEMSRSTFRIMNEPAGLAFGHDWTGGRREDPWQDYPQAAPAGLWSTPEDLARWLIAFGRAYRGEDMSLLTSESARAMARQIAGDTGLGFGVNGEGDSLYVTHAGWTIGYRSHVVYYPALGKGAVVMTNSDAGHLLINDLLRTIGRERMWPEAQPTVSVSRADWTDEARAALAGSYRVSPAGFVIRLEQVGADFRLTTPRGAPYTVIPIRSDALIIEETGAVIEIDQETGALGVWGMSANRYDANDRAAAPGPTSETPIAPIEYVYKATEGAELTAFVFKAEDDDIERPAVLLYHGGGWRSGRPDWTFGLARALAEQGVVAIPVEYRLSEGDITPIDAFEDVCSSLAWVRRHAEPLGVARDRIALHGVSAGGHLAALTGTRGCADGAEPPSLLLLHSPALSMARDGWFTGLLKDRATPDEYSPLDLITDRTPATFIVSGAEDTLTPHRYALEFCGDLNSRGVLCSIETFQGLGHILTRNLDNQESDFQIAEEDVLRARGALFRFLENAEFLSQDRDASG
jgi:CubicO group peptidase (beta-lactamase class C family)/acetyl esterase/lipase